MTTIKTPPIALQLIQACMDTQSAFLDLGNLGLISLPDELWGCTHITSLNLGDFYFDEEKKEKVSSKNKGNDNSIKALPTAIKRFSSLKNLSLAGNQSIKIDSLAALKKWFFDKSRV